MTLLVGSLNVVVAVPLSTTEMVEGLKVSALIVAVVQGSVTVMVKTTLSESDAGVNVVEPAGPLLAIVIAALFTTLIGHLICKRGKFQYAMRKKKV